jgi:hypothetical protein
MKNLLFSQLRFLSIYCLLCLFAQVAVAQPDKIIRTRPSKQIQNTPAVQVVTPTKAVIKSSTSSDVSSGMTQASPVLAALAYPSVKRGNLTYRLQPKAGAYTTPSYKTRLISASEETANDKICRTEVRNFTAESMSQDILNPEAIADLRLGAVYDFNDLGRGIFNSAKYANRNPMIFKITNNPGDVKIPQPTANNLANALDEIKNITFQDPPVGLGQYLETKTVNSSDALNIACGVSYTGYGFDVSANVGYNSQNKKNKFVLTYLNPIYTVTALPDDSGKLFNNDADNNNSSLVYMDKITYGVRLLIYFETELSEEETKLAFSASGYGAKGKWDSNKKSSVQQTDYKLFLFGRNVALKVGRNLDNIQNDIDALLSQVAVGNLNRPNQIGTPVSYSLKFLDGTTAATSCSVQNIPSVSCISNPNRPMNITLNLNQISLIEDADLYGNIEVRFFLADGREINNTNDPGNARIWNVEERAHLNQDDRVIRSQAYRSFTVSMDDINNGAYCRIYGWLNDYDSSSANDYFGLRDRSNEDRFGNYKQFILSQVLTCTASNNGNNCSPVLEAFEGADGCRFNFKFVVD